MDIDLSSQTAIVTGAAHGFGRAICQTLANHGARVWALDIIEQELAETVRLCVSGGGWCEYRVLDITRPEAIHELVAEIGAAGPPVGILVNNAVGVLGQVGQPVEAVTPDQWNAIFAVNVSGAFYLCQAVAPGMKAARRGRIINIASGAGLTITLTGIQAYAASKAGVINLVQTTANQLANGALP